MINHIPASRWSDVGSNETASLLVCFDYQHVRKRGRDGLLSPIIQYQIIIISITSLWYFIIGVFVYILSHGKSRVCIRLSIPTRTVPISYSLREFFSLFGRSSFSSVPNGRQKSVKVLIFFNVIRDYTQDC